jgi:hypothetical protein
MTKIQRAKSSNNLRKKALQMKNALTSRFSPLHQPSGMNPEMRTILTKMVTSSSSKLNLQNTQRNKSHNHQLLENQIKKPSTSEQRAKEREREKVQGDRKSPNWNLRTRVSYLSPRKDKSNHQNRRTKRPPFLGTKATPTIIIRGSPTTKKPHSLTTFSSRKLLHFRRIAASLFNQKIKHRWRDRIMPPTVFKSKRTSWTRLRELRLGKSSGVNLSPNSTN